MLCVGDIQAQRVRRGYRPAGLVGAGADQYMLPCMQPSRMTLPSLPEHTTRHRGCPRNHKCVLSASLLTHHEPVRVAMHTASADSPRAIQSGRAPGCCLTSMRPASHEVGPRNHRVRSVGFIRTEMMSISDCVTVAERSQHGPHDDHSTFHTDVPAFCLPLSSDDTNRCA